MKPRNCCADETKKIANGSTVAAQASASSGRRLHEAARWTLAATGFAVLPKCPACLAAYIALGTGVGISLGAATYLRMFLIAAGALSLVFLGATRFVVPFVTRIRGRIVVN